MILQIQNMTNIKYKYLWLFIILTMVALLNIGVIATDDMANQVKIHWSRHFINELSGTWTGFLLIPILLWFFKKMPIRRSNLFTSIPLHLMVTLLFGSVHTFLMYITRTPIYQWVGLGDYGEWYGVLEYRMIMEYCKQFLFYWIFYGGYLFFEKIKESQQQQIRAARLEEQLTKAHLNELKRQLNPHFLFNTLNAISSMMYEDIESADKMMASLSDMLRATLKIDREEHPIEKELGLMDLYLGIMKTRFNEQLSIKILVNKGLEKAMIPVFLLQPLVENSIKYGIQKNGSVAVKLSIKSSNQHLILEIEDDGPGIKEVTKNGIGWSNTLERLDKLFGEDYLFNLKNINEGGLHIGIQIPLHMEKI